MIKASDLTRDDREERKVFFSPLCVFSNLAAEVDLFIMCLLRERAVLPCNYNPYL